MDTNQDIYNFRTLRVYLFYRLILAVLLYIMYVSQPTSSALGNSDPELFRWVSVGYMMITSLSMVLLFDRSSFQSNYKVSVLLITDIVVLLILIHASGGITNGLGYLLVITAAIASMFLPGQLALAFAAVTSLLIIGETLYSTKSNNIVGAMFSAGTLGFLVFITSISFQYLTDKIRTSTKEAAEKTEYASQLVQLAQHIVARMRTGIAVLDEHNKIELINDSARQLLDLPRGQSYLGTDISNIGNLEQLVNNWRSNPITGMSEVDTINSRREIRINFASLDTANRHKTILYLEDYRFLIQQAQQLKLASLGRLTASIAHEVRNPLGAISHAAQLLSESQYLDPSDVRFTEIILQHSVRMNQIIENTMALSKRKEPKAELIDLCDWIPIFIKEYSDTKNCEITYHSDSQQPRVKMDPSHLRQILTNLFDNGLRYSMEATNVASITVTSGLSINDDTTFIDVVDNGAGVSEDHIQSIFEPFFTTAEHGTGLGLYLSRELCEINQASLSYLKTDDNKSCFKINFPHHQRMI